MLIEFEVGNYRSFNKTVRFSMVAANPIKELEENTFEIPGNQRLIKSAVIYGANASGKSNLLAAMRFVAKFVRISSTGMQVGEKISVEPFKLDAVSENRPSRFEVCFLLKNDRRYRFGFEADSKAVTREWLFCTEKMKEETLYLREGDGIEVTDRFAEGFGLEDKTRDNALFLSVVAQFNGEISGSILKWFSGFVSLHGLRGQNYERYTTGLLQKEETRRLLVGLIREADVGIEDLIVDEIPIQTDDLHPEPESKKPISPQLRISTAHTKFKDGQKEGVVGFNFSLEESEGTKKLFRIAGPLIDCLTNGYVVCIDELDAILHPLLTKAIVRMFNTPASNLPHSQLIFATHDTNLLQGTIFRRDQIWFTEKDQYSATDLYSLAEFKLPDGKKARNDASFEKNYILGRYGAIPFLGDMRAVLGEVGNGAPLETE